MATDLLENFLLKIIHAFILLRFESKFSGLPFAYRLYRILFLMWSKMIRELSYIFGQKPILSKLKIPALKFIHAIPTTMVRKQTLCHLHIICKVYYFLYLPEWPKLFMLFYYYLRYPLDNHLKMFYNGRCMFYNGH